jgi:Leucine-rich repeat (LRR) protein
MVFSHQDRIDAGVSFDWSSLPVHRTSLTDLPQDATELRFRRDGSSHRGIHRFSRLRRVWLYSVNQAFLEEVADIPTIEQLFIDGTTTADLTPLRRLRQLRRLIINGGTKIQSMDWVAGLPPLEALAIENFKRVFQLDPIASLTSLTALGIEGSIWTRMRVATLAPLSGLRSLRSLFLTNLTASDSSLRHLHSLTGLEVLQIGALFPDEELLYLRQALPRLRCDWFEMIDRHGSTREAIRVAVHGAR